MKYEESHKEHRSGLPAYLLLLLVSIAGCGGSKTASPEPGLVLSESSPAPAALATPPGGMELPDDLNVEEIPPPTAEKGSGFELPE